ncbi:MAG: hypothetical protein IPK07_02950 [Deltaproteobacteria bacterium]|nr:hypothetical protein [Deltaproteobacteria bacterium]
MAELAHPLEDVQDLVLLLVGLEDDDRGVVLVDRVADQPLALVEVGELEDDRRVIGVELQDLFVGRDRLEVEAVFLVRLGDGEELFLGALLVPCLA